MTGVKCKQTKYSTEDQTKTTLTGIEGNRIRQSTAAPVNITTNNQDAFAAYYRTPIQRNDK